MAILVTGGAGYIGSHVTRQLIEQGREVVVVDNLHRGHRCAVPPQADFYELVLAETGRLAELMTRHDIDAVMHFAALAYIAESVAEPLRYYENNVSGAISLLNAMQHANVGKIIFSSSCATYGIPVRLPLTEEMPQTPINPYGWSKLFFERILCDYRHVHPEFAYTFLRYFNVAGCSADGRLGEDHDPETHLIPILLQVALGQRTHVTVNGTDYPTPDGTCVRDYIHVEDLAAAHILALNALQPGDRSAYNLGNGQGFSVKQIIAAVEAVTGCPIRIEYGERRPGDPPALYASADRIRRELGWEPRYTEIGAIIQTAWDWFRQHPHGYAE
ncbi:MAG: UDP-glucose 4-epimerase GalE [Planctomycetaceae bacterium]